MNHQPILLFGMPRSGTTWLAKIFDSHPDTLYRHEPDSGGALKDIPLIVPIERTEEYRTVIQDFVKELPRFTSTRVAASLPVFRKSYYSEPIFLLHRWGLPLAKAVTRISGEFLLPSFTRFDRVSRFRVVWKSIESVGRLGAIVRAVQDHRAILILRHPCGYIASVLRGEQQQRFSDNNSASEDYEVLQMILATKQAQRRGLDLQAFKDMRPEERLAWRWLLFNEKALEDTQGLDGCTFVRYEDICVDPQGMARRMFDFARLKWNRQTEAFVRQSVGHERSGYYSVFKEPLQAANKWREQLSGDVIHRIYAVLEKSDLGRLYQEERGSVNDFNHQRRSVSIA